MDQRKLASGVLSNVNSVTRGVSNFQTKAYGAIQVLHIAFVLETRHQPSPRNANDVGPYGPYTYITLI